MGWGNSMTSDQLDQLITKAGDTKQKLSGNEKHKLEETARQAGSRGNQARQVLQKRDEE